MSTGTERRRKRARTTGRPGRPPSNADGDVRSALLDAASQLFLKHGFERVTARQIAAAAGTTPAMIHYYFSNKLGLFRAMLERVVAPLRELLAGSLAQPGAGIVEPTQIIRMHMHTVAANAWIPAFVINEVLAEKGKFRATFIRDIAARQAPLLIELFERGRASGRFRRDLDARYAALSLLSLCMFPFLAHAISGPVLGIKLEGEPLEGLIAHTVQLFMRGIENRPTET